MPKSESKVWPRTHDEGRSKRSGAARESDRGGRLRGGAIEAKKIKAFFGKDDGSSEEKDHEELEEERGH